MKNICIFIFNIRVYTSISPYPEITPLAFYTLYNKMLSPILVYNSDETRLNRVKLFKSIYEGLGSPIEYEFGIDAKNYVRSITIAINTIRKRLTVTSDIVVLLEDKLSEYFLETFYNKICIITGYNIVKECYEKYNVYVLDASHFKFNQTYSEGVNIITEILDDNTALSNKFLQETHAIGGADYYPTFFDSLVPCSTDLLLQTLSDSSSFSVDDFRNALYTSEVNTILGKLTVDSSNHIKQIIYYAKVNKEGIVKYVESISEMWSTNTYRIGLNEEEYKYCDWKTDRKDGATKPSFRIGVITPMNIYTIRQTVLFLSAILTSIKDINNEGGILNNYILPYHFSDGGSPEIVTERIRNAYEEKNITIFLGGFTYLFFITYVI